MKHEVGTILDGRDGVPPGARGYSTKDYARLKAPLGLGEYQVGLVPYEQFPKARPFAVWDASRPTQSLVWYDAHNKAKHDRTANLHLATLERCVEAVASTVVLFWRAVRTVRALQREHAGAALINHLFKIELWDPDSTSFYCRSSTSLARAGRSSFAATRVA